MCSRVENRNPCLTQAPPQTDDVSGARQAIDSVADGNPDRVEMRELADDLTVVGIEQEESHEPVAVVGGVVALLEKENPKLFGDGRHGRVGDGEGAPLGECFCLSHFRSLLSRSYSSSRPHALLLQRS